MKALNKAQKELIASISGQGIIEALRDGVCIQDTDFNILYQNKKAQSLLSEFVSESGYRDSKVRGGAYKDSPLKKSFRDGKVHTAVIGSKAGDKGFVLQVTSSPIKDSSGKIIAGIEIVQDLSVREQREERNDHAFEAGREWEEAFDIINDAITIHDIDFNIIRANKAAEKMLGVSSADILSRKCYESYHGSSSPPASCLTCKTLNTGLNTSSEMFEPFIDKHLEFKAFPRFDSDNRLIGLIHIVRDITAQKMLEEEREKLISDMTDALLKVKTLRGLLPICASCKKIRDDNGYWQQVDDYIREHSEADFTHGLCPECIDKHFPADTG